MKTSDRPKLIRQTIFNSITVLWCSILLVLISIFFCVPEVFRAAPPALSLPGAIHSHYEPKPGEIPTISIDVKGNFFLDDEMITDISKLSYLLEDKIHEMKCKGDKVLLNIDEDTQYGKIQEVFRILNKMNIKVAGLITEKNAAPIHFIKATTHQEL
jgi:biopolymer transport protein ExbD